MKANVRCFDHADAGRLTRHGYGIIGDKTMFVSASLCMITCGRGILVELSDGLAFLGSSMILLEGWAWTQDSCTAHGSSKLFDYLSLFAF